MKNHLKILAALMLTVALVCAACKKDPDNGGNNNGNGGENPQSFTVSVSANPSDGGSVSGGGSFEEGESCTVTAVPASDYTFTYWTEDGSQVSDAASYTFVVNSNRNLVANFISSGGGGNDDEEPQYYTVSLSVFPENVGTVTGSGSYQKGSTCTITATPNSGYTFVSWADEINEVSTDASYTFTVSHDLNLKAIFAYEFQGPTGAIKGKFTVNDSGDMVYFSQGNLQYNAVFETWRFAEHQWDYVGGTFLFVHYGNVDNSSNNDVSPNYDGWMDLFGWGTSGWDCGNTYYQPWETYYDWDVVDGEYFSGGRLYGPPGCYDLTGNYANSDWGHYNTISNGGGRWRTLTIDEWEYVFNSRSTDSGIRYARAQLCISNGEIIDGIILLPDDWNEIYYMLYDTNDAGASYESNVIVDWSIFKAHGAVFLPPTGTRMGLIYANGGNGCYWSASNCHTDKANAYSVFFDSYVIDPLDCDRMDGRAVRLVSPAEH